MRRLEALKPGDEAADGLVRGLRARKQGACVVLFLRYRAPLTGKLRKLDLGDWPAPLDLEEARKRARAQRDLLGQRIDPHEHRALVLATRKADAAARLDLEMLADRFTTAEARRLVLATIERYRQPGHSGGALRR